MAKHALDAVSIEQFTGVQVDIRLDLYSLGVTLWEMVTGKPPFRQTAGEVMNQHQHGFFGFVVLQLLLFIIRPPRVDSEGLCAGITIYLMLGLFWSLAYSLIDWLAPDSFVFNAVPTSGRSMQGFQALYFSFITLSTIGYGDIVPVSKLARMLAIVEAVTGMFYVTLLIARLVSLYSANQARND